MQVSPPGKINAVQHVSPPRTPGGSGGTTITTQDEGVTLSTTVDTLNFVGDGVTASGAGNVTTVTIPGATATAVPWTPIYFA